jgi:hypothetical protein
MSTHESQSPNAARFAHIPGWGADLRPEDRPAYPMERIPQRLEVPHDHIPQQHSHVTVFHSTERPGMTPVFGTSVPPTGLSGALRSVAFKYSENDLRHWLLLLVADRINVVEGLVQDLSHGHVPNLWREMGGRAELKHNPAGAMRKAALVGLLGVGVYVMVSRRRRARRLF